MNTLVGAVQTPDGEWRVEAHQLRTHAWYRLLHRGQVYRYRDGRNEVAADHLPIGSVRYLLSRHNVDLADMIEVSS